jgi:hypothetical protein
MEQARFEGKWTEKVRWRRRIDLNQAQISQVPAPTLFKTAL